MPPIISNYYMFLSTLAANPVMFCSACNTGHYRVGAVSQVYGWVSCSFFWSDHINEKSIYLCLDKMRSSIPLAESNLQVDILGGSWYTLNFLNQFV